jgi:putative DNA primase/helicase
VDNVEQLHARQHKPPVLDAPIWSDDRLALAFAERHANELRYVALWSKWLAWDGTRWRIDETRDVFDRVRQLCRDTHAANPTLDPIGVRALADATTFAAVERVSQSDRRLAATTGRWDSDLWVFNTPGGTVDLRMGLMHPHRREDHLTKVAAVSPSDEASCPMWMAFLRKVTAGDVDLQKYLQRLVGYCLTGDISEHVLVFLYGTGANGKGVFLNTLTGVFGQYATVAPAEVFQASNTDRHPTELAMLRGARLVTAQETEEGRRWAETRIKALTGGDPITARFMRADFFTFQPSFKLLIAGNHKPGLRSVDEAIRRRLHLVPFTVTIPQEERDRDLADKLRAEWPGILRWAIEGCVMWQEDGLRPPEAVLTATAEYFESADAFGAWLTECTERSASPWVRENTADLFASWKAWAEKVGEQAGTQRTFSELMSQRFTKKRQPGTGREGFSGVQLRRQNYTDDQWLGG